MPKMQITPYLSVQNHPSILFDGLNEILLDVIKFLVVNEVISLKSEERKFRTTLRHYLSRIIETIN